MKDETLILHWGLSWPEFAVLSLWGWIFDSEITLKEYSIGMGAF